MTQRNQATSSGDINRTDPQHSTSEENTQTTKRDIVDTVTAETLLEVLEISVTIKGVEMLTITNLRQ
jgi:hypothetical protein